VRIEEFYRLYWGRIENSWLSVLQQESGYPPVREIVLYQLNNPGKRLRPYLCTLLSLCLNAEIGGKELDFAAAVEMFHNASLIHDDLEDQDFYRRGKLNLWKKFSPAQAINMGDLFFTKSLEVILSLGISEEVKLYLVRLAISAINELIYGQMLEVSFRETVLMRWQDWEEIASQKTGALFRLIFEGVFLLSGINIRDCRDELNSVGRLAGIIYQMRDDLLDAMGLKDGRPRGSDILEGKMTCLSIKAMERGGENKEMVRSALLGRGDSDTLSRVNSLIDLYEEKNIIAELENHYSTLLGEFRDHPITVRFPQIKPAVADFLDLLLLERVSRSK
jgi:geranylgeranyl pyrophosphate synthase